MATSPPADFEPSTFLYLNPELPASSNVLTVEDAVARFPAEFGHLPYLPPADTAGALSGPDLATLYIWENRGRVDTSALNRVILEAAAARGEEDVAERVQRSGTYVPSIHAEVERTAPDTFELVAVAGATAAPLPLSSSNMAPGDVVEIFKDHRQRALYVTVAEVLDERRFRIEEAVDEETFLPGALRDGTYTLTGIRVLDPERIALINHTRIRLRGGEPDVLPDLEHLRAFNPDFYELLYTDARFLTRTDAFLNALNSVKEDTAPPRITRAEDIMNINQTDVPFTMNAPLILNEGLLLQGGAIVIDGFSLCNITEDSVSSYRDTAPGALISARAIKQFVERPYDTRADFRDVHVAGQLSVGGDAATGSGNNLIVDADSCRVQGDLTVVSNVVCEAGHGAAFFASQRLAVGGGRAQESPLPTPEDPPPLTDAFLASAHVADTLSVGGHWLMRSERLQDGRDVLSLRHAAAGSPASPPPPLVTMTDGADVPGARPRLQINGDVRSTGTIASVSDARSKRDVRPIRDALSKVLQLRGCTFEHLAPQPCAPAARGTGLLAQDVERVLPEAVVRDAESGELALAYGNLAGLLVEAIRDLASLLPPKK